MNNMGQEIIINRFMQSPNLVNNQLAHNAVQMFRTKDSQGIQQMMNNLCKERGIPLENIQNQARNILGIK